MLPPLVPSPKMHRRRFIGRSLKAAAAVCAGAGLYAWRVEPHWIDIVHRPMPLAGLPDRWAGKRLVQISDLHVGPVVSQSFLERALSRVNQLRPDLVVVTGDWMTCTGDEQVEPAYDLMRKFAYEGPLVGILGNHDYGRYFRDKRPANQLTAGLQQQGVVMLRNETIDLDGLPIAGVDDLWSRQCRIQKTVAAIDRDREAIMLCHNPDGVDHAGWKDFRGWVLSGHTHGGQCRVPGWGAPIVPIENRKYTAGEIVLSPTRRLYVNRALGYKRRVRFLAPPEITVFELRPA